MKITKINIIAFVLIGTILSLTIFVLEPLLKDSYFTDDIFDFKRNSWKYTIGFSLMLVVASSIYAFKNKNFSRNLIIYNLMIVSFISLFGKGIIDNVLLYANLKIDTEKYSKNYVVIRHDPNKVFHIYDHKTEFIVSDVQLKKIDSIRIKNKLKSLYQLQNNDTLTIVYKKGFLNVKFLK